MAVVLSDASESEIDTGSLALIAGQLGLDYFGSLWLQHGQKIFRHKKDQESTLADERNIIGFQFWEILHRSVNKDVSFSHWMCNVIRCFREKVDTLRV